MHHQQPHSVHRVTPLLPLPDYKKRRVVIGTTVRKPLPILQAFLQSLDWQEWPADVTPEYCFVPDFAPDQSDAAAYLFRWVNERKGCLLEGVPATQPDFSDAAGLDSHQWGSTAMARVGANKNRIIQYALNSKADALWYVDADLILDRTTFASMDACEKPIITAAYWTRWSKQRRETGRIYAQPQVWLTHPYGLAGRGMDEAEFIGKLLDRGVHQVWGFGACTLLSRRVLEAGVNFDYLPDVSQQGLMGGEDRHLCIRAERLHIPAYADCWPDIFHIYHADEDVARIPQMAERLGAAHPDRAELGDLVSLRLRPLEPVPVGPGRFQQVQPQLVRGRLGSVKLIPEIEEAVYTLERGKKTILRAHFPIHYPLPLLRGRTRLIEVTLLDVKRFGFPPVVEDDLHVGPNSGAWHHDKSLTDQQRELVNG